MATSFASESLTIGALLGHYERRTVAVPPFQRSFSWEKSQLTTFWSDLMTFQSVYAAHRISASYFIGPIVMQKRPDEITLLDGQQRLATATILFAAIRDYARKLLVTGGTEGSDLARDVQRELIEKDGAATQFSLKLGELDQPFFLRWVQEDPPKQPKPTIRSHRLIQSAYNYFSEELTRFADPASPKDAVKKLRLLKDCVDKGMTVVAINVEKEEDAYHIFETLNDRGLRLSIPDLLLNLLMRRANDPASRTGVRGKWNYMLQELRNRDIAQFLRHMWLSKHGDLKSRGLYVEIQQHLQEGDIESVAFAESCSEECDDYVSLVENNSRIPKDAKNDIDGIVRHLRITSALPLLLSGLRCLNENDFAKLARLVVSLSVRYSVVCNLNPADIESTFYVAARTLRNRKSSGDKSAKCLLAAKELLSGINPPDSKVEESAADIEIDRSQAIWMIECIARSRQGITGESGFDKCNLEHIFPQNPGAEWPDRIQLEPYTWHLGNLTLLGTRLNRNARNKSFKDKCSQYYKGSEVKLTQDILDYSKWTATEIKDRAKELAKEIVKIWPA